MYEKKLNCFFKTIKNLIPNNNSLGCEQIVIKKHVNNVVQFQMY